LDFGSEILLGDIAARGGGGALKSLMSISQAKNVFAVIGVGYTAYLGWRLLNYIRDYSFHGNNLWKYKVNKSRAEQTYAVVTGASYGVGEGMAVDLAREGFNLVLVARSKDLLNQLSEKLQKQYEGIQVAVVAEDASSDGAAERIVEKIQNLPISVLVNNVGVTNKVETDFETQDLKEISNLIKVNVEFTTHFTQLMIPVLRATQKSKQVRSAIVNVSSYTARVASPYLSVYSATKAYDIQFSRSLNYELENENFDVLCAVPQQIVSRATGYEKATFLVLDPQQFAKDTWRFIGRYTAITPSFSHSLMAGIGSIVSEAPAARMFLGMMKEEKERKLKKKAN
jgi:17beta-estradiol 17-dehydrogenase / very-long-chain 3-oxoacyl-CoA reductase